MCKFCDIGRVSRDDCTVRGPAFQRPNHDIYIEKEDDDYVLDIGCDMEGITYSMAIHYCPMCGRKLEAKDETAGNV